MVEISPRTPSVEEKAQGMQPCTFMLTTTYPTSSSLPIPICRFFGQNTQSVTFLCELVSDSAGNSRGTCKTSNGQDSQTSEFVDLMKSALSKGGNSSSTSSAADDIMSLF